MLSQAGRLGGILGRMVVLVRQAGLPAHEHKGETMDAIFFVSISFILFLFFTLCFFTIRFAPPRLVKPLLSLLGVGLLSLVLLYFIQGRGQRSEGLTWAKIDAIKMGMSRDEVCQILGTPLIASTNQCEESFWIAAQDGYHFGSMEKGRIVSLCYAKCSWGKWIIPQPTVVVELFDGKVAGVSVGQKPDDVYIINKDLYHEYHMTNYFPFFPIK